MMILAKLQEHAYEPKAYILKHPRCKSDIALLDVCVCACVRVCACGAGGGIGGGLCLGGHLQSKDIFLKNHCSIAILNAIHFNSCFIVLVNQCYKSCATMNKKNHTKRLNCQSNTDTMYCNPKENKTDGDNHLTLLPI